VYEYPANSHQLPQEILEHLEGIGTVYLNADDVVRHRLVREIILAYEKLDEEQRQRKLAENAKKLPSANVPASENIPTNLIDEKKVSE
jgi:adenylylsulfate kinase-like enzyme